MNFQGIHLQEYDNFLASLPDSYARQRFIQTFEVFKYMASNRDFLRLLIPNMSSYIFPPDIQPQIDMQGVKTIAGGVNDEQMFDFQCKHSENVYRIICGIDRIQRRYQFKTLLFIEEDEQGFKYMISLRDYQNRHIPTMSFFDSEDIESPTYTCPLPIILTNEIMRNLGY